MEKNDSKNFPPQPIDGRALGVQKFVLGMADSEEHLFIKFLKEKKEKEAKLLTNLYDTLKQTNEKKIIWQKLYASAPGASQIKNPDGKLRKDFHRLKTAIETFYINIALDRELVSKNMLLLKELSRRGLDNEFDKLFKKTIIELEKKQQIRDSSYHQATYELLLILRTHLVMGGSSKLAFSLKKLIQHFDLNWILKKSNHQIIRLTEKGLKDPTAFPSEIFAAIIKHALDNPKHWESPLLQLHDQLLALCQDEFSDFHTLFKNYQTVYPLLSAGPAQDIFHTLQNYCTRLIQKSNNNEFYTDLYELFEWGIKEKMILQGGILSNKMYKNIITCCLQIQEYNKARDYIDSLKPFLPEDSRDEYARFCLGGYYFSQKEFKKVREIFSVKFSEVNLEIQSRFLIGQSFYDESEGWDLLDFLKALKSFIIYQKKLAKLQTESYLNRIHLFQKLIKLPPENSLEKTKLHNEILSTSPLSSPQWLLDKTKP